jgi:hypothetical protein
MDTEHARLLNEVRYSERLCQRTARLYRRIQAAGTVATIIGGSAAVSAVGNALPPVISMAGGACFVVFGALLLAIRPADKAAVNEADLRRYSKLRTEGVRMSTVELLVALNKARESDAPEVEPLREVAFNDVVREIGAEDQVVALRLSQRLLAALA